MWFNSFMRFVFLQLEAKFNVQALIKFENILVFVNYMFYSFLVLLDSLSFSVS